MNINKKTKASVAGVGAIAAASVLAGGLVAPANAAAPQTASTHAVTTAHAVHTKAAPAKRVKMTPKQKRALKIKQYKKKYGMFPLPIAVASAKKYRLNKTQVKQIKISQRWAKSSKARKVVRCESGGNYKINTGNGYYGAWQFNRGTWLANGGGKFGRTANKAPKWAQDYIAWKTWKSRGWSPWACA